jgi:uncharacterized membrane protein YgcG
MAGSSGFSDRQRERLRDALAAAERATGVRFLLRVGDFDDERPRAQAERLLAWSLDRPAGDPAVLLAVSPGQRRAVIVTSRAARPLISDRSSAVALTALKAAVGIGDLTGGLLQAISLLGDAARAARVRQQRPRRPLALGRR